MEGNLSSGTASRPSVVRSAVGSSLKPVAAQFTTASGLLAPERPATISSPAGPLNPSATFASAFGVTRGDAMIISTFVAQAWLSMQAPKRTPPVAGSKLGIKVLSGFLPATANTWKSLFIAPRESVLVIRADTSFGSRLERYCIADLVSVAFKPDSLRPVNSFMAPSWSILSSLAMAALNWPAS